MRFEKHLAQFMINSYGGKYGKVDHSDCTEVTPFNFNHTDGYTCKWQGSLVIAFRGSHGEADWIDNFKYRKAIMDIGNISVKIHQGFREQYFSVRRHLLRTVKKPTNIVVVGHSLGGALAQICALDLWERFPYVKMFCRSYGAPRVGGLMFRYMFNNTDIDAIRYVYNNDIVPRVPMPIMNYYHTKNKIHFNTGKGTIFQKLFGNPNDHHPTWYFENV